MEGHLRLVQTGYEERLDRLGQAMDAAMGNAKLSAAANEDAIIAALPKIAVSAERQDMPTYTALMAEVCAFLRTQSRVPASVVYKHFHLTSCCQAWTRVHSIEQFF